MGSNLPGVRARVEQGLQHASPPGRLARARPLAAPSAIVCASVECARTAGSAELHAGRGARRQPRATSYALRAYRLMSAYQAAPVLADRLPQRRTSCIEMVAS